MTIQLPAPTASISADQLNALLDTHGANFEVDTVPTPNPINPDEPTGYYTSYRTDDGTVFAQGLAEGWTPIQNRDSLKILSDLSGITDVRLEKFFMFGGGREICAQLDLGEHDIGGGDKVSNYLSVLNGHDGGHALSVYETPFRWWCRNVVNSSKVHAAKRKTLVSIRHTISAKDRIEKLVEAVRQAHGDFAKTVEIFKTLRNTKVSNAFAYDIIDGFFPKKDDLGKKATTIRKKKMDDVYTRYHFADGGRTEKETAWNLYNTVQGHIQHFGKNTEAHQKSVMYGNDNNRAAQAMAFILSLTASQHIAQSLALEEKEAISLI